MKRKEERNVRKEETKATNKKLSALTDEELEQINGGQFTDLGNYTIDVDRHRQLRQINGVNGDGSC